MINLIFVVGLMVLYIGLGMVAYTEIVEGFAEKCLDSLKDDEKYEKYSSCVKPISKYDLYKRKIYLKAIGCPEYLWEFIVGTIIAIWPITSVIRLIWCYVAYLQVTKKGS